MLPQVDSHPAWGGGGGGGWMGRDFLGRAEGRVRILEGGAVFVCHSHMLSEGRLSGKPLVSLGVTRF